MSRIDNLHDGTNMSFGVYIFEDHVLHRVEIVHIFFLYVSSLVRNAFNKTHVYITQNIEHQWNDEMDEIDKNG